MVLEVSSGLPRLSIKYPRMGSSKEPISLKVRYAGIVRDL